MNKPPAPHPILGSCTDEICPPAHEEEKPSVDASRSASRWRWSNGSLRKTRSRSTTRTEYAMRSTWRSSPYLSVEIMLAPLEPCCAVGTGSSRRSEVTPPNFSQKACVASSRLMITKLRSLSRRRDLRKVSSTLPPFHQHVLRLVHIMTSFASASSTSLLGFATCLSSALSRLLSAVCSHSPKMAPSSVDEGGQEDWVGVLSPVFARIASALSARAFAASSCCCSS
mmetsp:Transcript_29221/g.62784  ORF Transcript_29221/g.62784 Transcript_29221/m.62784 type:complete len:226 (+) Transcript_29221:453-1130(+)